MRSSPSNTPSVPLDFAAVGVRSAPRFLTASVARELGILLTLSVMFPIMIHVFPVPDDTRLTHVFDPNREVITGQFGTRLFPETWIIDREGRVRFRYDGALDWGNPIAVELVEAYR